MLIHEPLTSVRACPPATMASTNARVRIGSATVDQGIGPGVGSAQMVSRAGDQAGSRPGDGPGIGFIDPGGHAAAEGLEGWLGGCIHSPCYGPVTKNQSWNCRI